MTDRKLLEMAAKAAEFGQESKHGPCWAESEYPRGSKTHGALWNYKGHMDTAELWNPLTDDGDAFRLAVKLGLVVLDWRQYQKAMAEVRHGPARGEYWDDVGNDPLAATRRAIVRAAAEIGKGMP